MRDGLHRVTNHSSGEGRTRRRPDECVERGDVRVNLPRRGFRSALTSSSSKSQSFDADLAGWRSRGWKVSTLQVCDAQSQGGRSVEPACKIIRRSTFVRARSEKCEPSKALVFIRLCGVPC
jgi:hypothetical protein